MGESGETAENGKGGGGRQRKEVPKAVFSRGGGGADAGYLPYSRVNLEQSGAVE